jgi:hypothetical protein
VARPSDKEIEESFERATGYGLSLDSEDEALLRHVLLDDEPRQGLHQHGDKDYAICLWHGHFYSGEPKCPVCRAMEEQL